MFFKMSTRARGDSLKPFPISVTNFLVFFQLCPLFINKYMALLSKLFRAAIAKGVCDIADGKLRKLTAHEKRQLLAILRKRGDCPVKWINIAPEKQQNIRACLHQAIERLLNPEKVKEYHVRNYRKRKKSGAVLNDRKKCKESGKRKKISDRHNTKISKALREAKVKAIAEYKNHPDPTWDEDTLERLATDIVKQIVEKCGPDGFVHVFGGAWPRKNLEEAVEAECFGIGNNNHAVFIDSTGGRHKFVRYRDVSEYIELLTPYSGTNCVNADDLEKRVQQKLLNMGWPQHRRMFKVAGAGTCRKSVSVDTPFPYYTCVLVCDKSMEEIGIRLATKEDRAPKKKRILILLN